MTLDEAIKHCEEVAEANDLAAETYEILAENNHNLYEKLTAETNSARCAECAADHRQLAEWLTELKLLKAIIAEYDNVDMQKLEMVLAMIRTGSEDAWAKIEREKELVEAKRLLKLAVEDFSNIYDHILDCDRMCDICPLSGERDHCLKWRYAVEAEKVIKEG